MEASYCYKATPSYGRQEGRQRERREKQEEIVVYTSDGESMGAWIKGETRSEKSDEGE